MNDAPEAWARLGLAPTGDRAEVRRAYARALKAIDPARDPQAFQDLREALETITAGLEGPQMLDEAGQEQQAAEFVEQIRALRQAGDSRGAMALVDQLFNGQPPGSRLIEIVGQMLFETMALETSLSPGLFRHLVEQFDWRDATGNAAQADPERHSVLLARVAAEDWHQALEREAQAGDVVAATALSHPSGPVTPPVLDDAGKAAAAEVLGCLMGWDQFLLHRFDARSLAALRESVEGPPLVNGIPKRRQAAGLASIARRRLGLSGIAALVLLGVGFVMEASRSRWFGGAGVPPSPAAQARSILDSTQATWVEARSNGTSTLVYFTQLVSCRAALAAVRYGLDRDDPDQTFPLPPDTGEWPQRFEVSTKVFVAARANVQSVSVRLVYADGGTSPVHVYQVRSGP